MWCRFCLNMRIIRLLVYFYVYLKKKLYFCTAKNWQGLFYRWAEMPRGKSGQLEPPCFLTGSGPVFKDRIKESATENKPPEKVRVKTRGKSPRRVLVTGTMASPMG